jgi:hypothetical protein
MTWTKSVIREARKADLVPILLARGYRLLPAANGNYRVLPDPDHDTAPVGLVVKQNFWTWNEKHVAGNAIDFFTQIEGKTFRQAMEIILAPRSTAVGASHYDTSEPEIREVPGPVPETAR